MATVASGQIDMNAVHVELGGGSGNSIGFNDADLRLMCGSNQNTQFGMANMYAKAADFVQSGTVGTGSTTFSQSYISITTYFRGFASGSTTPANLSPTSESDYMGGGTISGVYCTSSSIFGVNQKSFQITSTAANVTNSDNTIFNSVVVNATTFDRGDFTFTSGASTTLSINDTTPGVGFLNTTDTIAPFPANNTTYYVTFRRRI